MKKILYLLVVVSKNTEVRITIVKLLEKLKLIQNLIEIDIYTLAVITSTYVLVVVHYVTLSQ